MRRLAVAAAPLLALALLSSLASAKGPASAYHARGSSNFFWFVHISDTHIGTSVIEDSKQLATPHLEYTLNEAIPLINPTFVVVTGDLTDGSAGVVPTIGKQQDEWDTYRQLYLNAGMSADFFFDTPGNHDAYGESGGLSYYLANSLQGKTNGVPYFSWIVDVPDGEVLFFGLNSEGTGISPMTNPAANFPDDCLDYYEQTLNAHKDAQLVVVASHHDLGGDGSDRVISGLKAMGGGYYLHGHVHAYEEYTTADNTVVVNQVNSLGKANTDNIAIVAYDHNAIAYRATSVENPWPFVLITAPVSAQLRDGGDHPYSYAVCKDRKDNPVRALVFAETAVTSVSVQVAGGAAVPMKAVAIGSPLYEAEVDTTSVPAGVYEVAVVAKIGTKEVFHKINTEFVGGPCEDLPVDPAAGGAGGSAGAAGSGAGGDGGTAGAAGSSGSGGIGGQAGAAGKGGSSGGASGAPGKGGAAGSPAELPEETSADEGGCACSAVGSSDPGAGLWGGLLLGLMGLARNRRRSRARIAG